ncbi:hypothetical protein [Vibrio splendidus]|uniref:Uncharacterized protein n=2 Tax=Vibrio splendidus TaxID=29497 RepID=A0A837NSF4_VIBSP|nr:hypothetical protein [Vibrio splendidus]KPL95749.1 hypothetical protein AN168_00155 [Vibrio splendidus]
MKLIKTLAFSMIVLTSNAYAITDASKIGANSGAMNYCYDNFSDPSQNSKYKILKLKTYEKYRDLLSDERARALLMKRAAEGGDYLGDPLDKSRCNSLRKVLYIKYN